MIWCLFILFGCVIFCEWSMLLHSFIIHALSISVCLFKLCLLDGPVLISNYISTQHNYKLHCCAVSPSFSFPLFLEGNNWCYGAHFMRCNSSSCATLVGDWTFSCCWILSLYVPVFIGDWAFSYCCLIPWNLSGKETACC